MKILSAATLCATLSSGAVADSSPPTPAAIPGYRSDSANPILPGYFADASFVEHEGHYYIYATLDPWGGEKLGCWSSSDLKNWTYHDLNWPTKQVCTSPTSQPNMVWAPSVIATAAGEFVMYVSVGSEIWVGKSAHPLGPWHNALGDKPLIPGDFRPGFHMIDAEAFIDENGETYLYWGSGWNWVNGKCWAVKLRPDLTTFAGEPVDVTPANYFEAPFVLKRGGIYYLMYSQGKTTDDSYRVHYATGTDPLGPFSEAPNSPVLVKNTTQNILGPGHHTVFNKDGLHYILYHRHAIPLDPSSTRRQLCIDEMRFDSAGLIEKITPSHEGPALIRNRQTGMENLASPERGARAYASSERDDMHGAGRVLDRNYATRWAPAPDATKAWLELDLGETRAVRRQQIRFEYPWKSYAFYCEASLNRDEWTPVADFSRQPAGGSPCIIDTLARARYLRLRFEHTKPLEPSIIEWVVE
jgi:beta-xylosidase